MDHVQEVFAWLWKNKDKYEKMSFAFMKQRMIWRYQDVMRLGNKEAVPLTDDGLQIAMENAVDRCTMSPSQQVEYIDLLNSVEQHEDKYMSTVLTMRAGGYSIRDIQERLGKSKEAIATKIHHSRAKARNEFPEFV